MTRTWRPLILAALALGPVLPGCTVEPKPTYVQGSPSDPAVIAGQTPLTPPMPKVEARPPSLLSSKRTDAPKVIDLIEESIRAAGYGKLNTALRSLEEAVEMDPTNRRALAMLAQVAQRAADESKRPQNSSLYLQSADAMRKLRAHYPQMTEDERRYLPRVLYNEAATLALSGESAKAMKSLVDAVDSGLNDPVQLDADPDIDALRKLPEFPALQAKVERRAVEAALAKFQPYPIDFRLPGLDGKAVALADVKGAVTLVDFWGTWCAPCRKELPHLVEIAKKYKDKGVRVVGLNYEQQDGDAGKKLIQDAIKSAGIPYPCLIGDDETQKKVPEFPGFPTLLLLDKTGKVRLMFGGYQSQGTIEVAVNTLLDEGKPQPATKP